MHEPTRKDRARLEKGELLERLARGHEAGITVVTPNRRLAQALQSEFSGFQAARGLRAWETPAVLPFDAFVRELWEDALYSDLAAEVPLMLSGAQEQALWEEAIQGTRYAQIPGLAAPAAVQCRQAWQLAHGWRVSAGRGPHSEDVRAFLDWSSRYERATRERHQTDAARLPDVVASRLGHGALRKPGTLVLFGFDIVTPQAGEFLDVLEAQGCEVVKAVSPARRASVTRVELADAKDEIDAAARWARSRLVTAAQPPSAGRSPRIGIVVPDLASSRARVQRVFSSVLQPAHGIAANDPELPFNISLGAALADFPLVADALLAIELAGAQTTFEHASRVIRSPFTAGSESEMEARARLDAWLRERCAPAIALDSLVHLCGSSKAPRAAILRDRLAQLADFRKSDLFVARPASEWARAFSKALGIMGFPGERVLDSGEHQTLDKWHELLADFATLERVTGRMGFNAARERLRSMARDELFQPEARDVPIQVMGILESAGQEFDHLWVMGLTDEAWPLPARPNPFLPVQAQRAAGVPQADPVSSLELDRRITQAWLGAAGEVVVSHPRMKKESELAPSPLIASIALSDVESLASPRYRTLREVIRAASVIETMQDGQAPAVAEAAQRGGTGLFRDQAACPFRAFAVRRLRSESLETPRLGLNTGDRGKLVHGMLAGVWKALGTREGLRAIGEGELGALLAKCADAAIVAMKRDRADALAGRYARLERERLVGAAREWLVQELGRDDFEVIAVEEKRPLTFGGITVSARLDRMDKLGAGGHAIIDYKTGKCSISQWMGKRPDEPQLPMYALGGAEDIAAVTFAQVKKGDMRFKGVARAAKLLPGACTVDKAGQAGKPYRDWGALVEGWRLELEATGRDFARGDARVDPKRGTQLTCQNCEQPMLCRIAEKAPFAAAAEGEGDADE